MTDFPLPEIVSAVMIIFNDNPGFSAMRKTARLAAFTRRC